MQNVLRYSWASPCSLVGLTLGALIVACGGKWRVVSGILEIALPAWATSLRHDVAAVTFGHVVLGISMEELERLRPHELVHVRQYEVWGVLFFLAYPLSSLVQLLRGRRPYRDNHFEIQARQQSGGDSGSSAPQARRP